MKVRIAFLLTGALVGPAMAQAIVSHGVGLSHDCYMMARTGRDARGGVETCSQALKDEPLTAKDKAATHDNRGVMLDALGRTDEAAEDFQRSMTLDPSLGDPHVNMGSILIKRRQYVEALDNINKGLALGMSFPHVGYYDRAVAEEMLGRFKEAYYDYKKVLELQPGYSLAEERLKDFTVTTKPAGGST